MVQIRGVNYDGSPHDVDMVTVGRVPGNRNLISIGTVANSSKTMSRSATEYDVTLLTPEKAKRLIRELTRLL